MLRLLRLYRGLILLSGYDSFVYDSFMQTDYLGRLTRHLLKEDDGDHWCGCIFQSNVRCAFPSHPTLLSTLRSVRARSLLDCMVIGGAAWTCAQLRACGPMRVSEPGCRPAELDFELVESARIELSLGPEAMKVLIAMVAYAKRLKYGWVCRARRALVPGALIARCHLCGVDKPALRHCPRQGHDTRYTASYDTWWPRPRPHPSVPLLLPVVFQVQLTHLDRHRSERFGHSD